MYHVLIAVDNDEDRSLAQARALADHPGVDDMTVSILHTFGENVGGASATQIASVREVKDYLEGQGLDVDVYERSGNPSREIVAVADELDVDMICVGGRKRSPAGKMLFGSVAQAVILNSAKPVFITGGPLAQ